MAQQQQGHLQCMLMCREAKNLQHVITKVPIEDAAYTGDVRTAAAKLLSRLVAAVATSKQDGHPSRPQRLSRTNNQGKKKGCVHDYPISFICAVHDSLNTANNKNNTVLVPADTNPSVTLY